MYSFSTFIPSSAIHWSLTTASMFWYHKEKKKYCYFLSWVNFRMFQGCLIDRDIISLYKYESLGLIFFFKWQQKLFKCFIYYKGFKFNILNRVRFIPNCIWSYHNSLALLNNNSSMHKRKKLNCTLIILNIV